MEEQAAIRRLKQGDISGLETLVRLHQVQAVTAAYLITRDRAMAEDIVQTAFIRAYTHIRQFNEQRRFGPWLYRCVVNDALKAVKRRRRHISLESMQDSEVGTSFDWQVDSKGEPSTLLEQAETREEVWTALSKLTPTQRAVVVQRYYLNMSEEQMANSLACRPGTIKSRLNAARTRLRLLLHPLQATEPSPDLKE